MQSGDTITVVELSEPRTLSLAPPGRLHNDDDVICIDDEEAPTISAMEGQLARK